MGCDWDRGNIHGSDADVRGVFWIERGNVGASCTLERSLTIPGSGPGGRACSRRSIPERRTLRTTFCRSAGEAEAEAEFRADAAPAAAEEVDTLSLTGDRAKRSRGRSVLGNTKGRLVMSSGFPGTSSARLRESEGSNRHLPWFGSLDMIELVGRARLDILMTGFDKESALWK